MAEPPLPVEPPVETAEQPAPQASTRTVSLARTRTGRGAVVPTSTLVIDETLEPLSVRRVAVALTLIAGPGSLAGRPVHSGVARRGRSHTHADVVDHRPSVLVDLWDDLILPPETRTAWQPLIDEATGQGAR
ncbi:hypothetical protein [Oerskovia sp. KBS0722]|uniref:hypothetical protein n=1 Tax=Oerskovia sp. KBS0722 TaxID=1179673 RepID=UPI00110DC1EB|nr:hypothetical protein [Oerskovia sp. KBS0722]QDW63287.1 hypothetical protein FFI11_012900 [Oerskovia sp. KBS0722]